MAFIFIPVGEDEVFGDDSVSRCVQDAVITVRIKTAAFNAIHARLGREDSRWYMVSCQVAPGGYSLTIRRK